MGTIVSSFFTTVDGVVEAPHRFHFPYFDEAMGQIVDETMQGAEAFLMGRRLYDEWSDYWGGYAAGGEDQSFADTINAMPKYVVSTTLADPTWQGTTVLPPDPGAVRALKERTSGTITMSGSATTVRWLLANGLLDELNLLVDPIAYGDGDRLFHEGAQHPLQLLSCRALDTGVLHLRYRPVS